MSESKRRGVFATVIYFTVLSKHVETFGINYVGGAESALVNIAQGMASKWSMALHVDSRLCNFDQTRRPATSIMLSWQLQVLLKPKP